ncbi:MAG: hypothetical protein DRO73_03725 [Candidatus Thorarchaeota archaeon]|nr:MAG: hypothetical protein DRO73_03725 [Candidatus Thorarchaeota archaeon]RLI61266.1 MAG: hypothetical protein DRO93_04815 [Candidatus Thorarchaeota archaeon]
MSERGLEAAEFAVKRAESLGADQAEAYVGISRTFSIDVENSAIKSAAEKRDAGCGVRCVVAGRVGFAYVTTLDDNDITQAVTNALSLARVSVPDPDFSTLPSVTGSSPRVNGLYDRAMAEIDSESATEIVTRVVDSTAAGLEGRDFAIEAQVKVHTRHVAVANSLGIHHSYEGTFGYVYSSPTIKVDGEQTSTFDYEISRRLNRLNPEAVGKRVAEMVLSMLGARSIEGGTLPVILEPEAVSVILGSGFGAAVNAEEVQFGRSYISDALGDEIASLELTIVDDALLEGGVGSRPFDAEGVFSQRTVILEKGVLKSLLHNSYTSQKDGVENTANASRGSYMNLPSISTSNFVVRSERGSVDDLVQEFGRGVICRDTGDRPNMTTGDLSAMIMEGFYFENGDIKHPLKNTLIGINMRDLLKRVVRVGGDVRQTSGAITPSIVIESATVTSG